MSVLFAARAAELPRALAPGEPAIEAEGVGVEIDGKRILHDVDLTVRSGEVVALIGPNGAGKSTLLAAIAGDQRMTAGTVRFAGMPLGEWNLRDLSRRRAVLLQEQRVSFPFTVEQVVEMGRAPWRRTEREDDDEAAVDDALRQTDIERFRPRHVPSLSGGERARAGLARVLAQRTGILLLDEPTAALDLRHQEDVLRLARERAARGDAVAVVLHDLNLAGAYADRIALLSDGRVVATGAPGEVLTPERIEQVYRQRVEILTHPVSGATVILPVRDAGPSPDPSAPASAT
ncbi:heme ABC transporter ATP-binding protein [Microbacterium marinilacus]|uniref:Heme ABC transporter ATP-binding protein n=1 Tax=Microbacterium marinilacus TaxID=415209 RepID=A0ABP7BT21_9MICO|nr:heme ABC transporter ATP-binding protein [Microbacterium marinilacus]MBY0688285.1 heme ABC transporter ATP-binding protein [Microbacterium marinilacus]